MPHQTRAAQYSTSYTAVPTTSRPQEPAQTAKDKADGGAQRSSDGADLALPALAALA